MRYSSDKAIAAFVRLLLSDGWQYYIGKHHGKLIAPNGRRIAVPGTPSDHRAFHNFKCSIRKIIEERQQ